MLNHDMVKSSSDQHSAWLQTPLRVEAGNDRFVARRAARSEHAQFFELVNLAFGEERPRAEFDWMYHRNPTGQGRTWLIFDRDSGQLVSGESSFPWPISRGHQALRGELVGDSVTHPDWRSQGLGALRLAAREAHPWRAQTMAVGGPNVRSRNLIHKLKRNDALMGPFAAGTIVLQAGPALERLGCPSSLVKLMERPANATLEAWRGLFFHDRVKPQIEEVRRFDSEFDGVSDRCMSWSKFWCPHNSDFLNWRYLDHPTQSHLAFAIVEEERPVAYCAVRVSDEIATLVDFAAPQSPRRIPRSLLGHAVEVAQAANCRHLDFFAPPSWRHWPLFRQAGFLPSPLERWIIARGYGMTDALELRNWQLMPGDDA
jgi:GNAT superfamily N-acetyltransferase